jgi:AcrR family transcriptional regulator
MKGNQRRTQVLRCATELFAERGYHQTTVEDIVTRAGIARGTFYVYFHDKRSIFDELLDGFMAEINERIIRIDPALGADGCLELLRKNVREIVATCVEQQLLTKILLSDAVGLDPDFDRKLLDFYAQALELLESALVLGQEMGVVRKSCDARLVSICILGALKEIMVQVTMRGFELDVTTAVEELLALYLHGLFVLPGG